MHRGLPQGAAGGRGRAASLSLQPHPRCPSRVPVGGSGTAPRRPRGSACACRGGGGQACAPGQPCRGTGQLGGAENRPLPPPEGAPRTAGHQRAPSAAARGSASAARGKSSAPKPSFWGRGGGTRGEQTTFSDAQRTRGGGWSGFGGQSRGSCSLVWQDMPLLSSPRVPAGRWGRPWRPVAPGCSGQAAGGTGCAGPRPPPVPRLPASGSGTHCDTWVIGASSVSPSRSRSSVKLLVLRKRVGLTSSSAGLLLTAREGVGVHQAWAGRGGQRAPGPPALGCHARPGPSPPSGGPTFTPSLPSSGRETRGTEQGPCRASAPRMGSVSGWPPRA